MKAVINLFLICCLLASCKDGENGPHRSRMVDDIVYDLVQIPVSEMGQNNRDSIADLMYYKLTISERGKKGRIRQLTSPSNYNRLLYYANDQISSDLSMSNGKGNLTPIQTYFESQARLSGRLVFMLAFEKPVGTTDNITVEFRDNIFNNGPIKFNYRLSDLNTL